MDMSEYVKLMSSLIVTQERLIEELQELVTITAKRGDVDKNLVRIVELTTAVHKINEAMDEERSRINKEYQQAISGLHF